MTEYLTEQEQIALLKNWVKQYSLVILAGVAIAAIIISGWRYWEQRQANLLSHASIVYDDMLMARAQNDAQGTVVQAEKLFAHYARTVYGQMAALMLARSEILKKNYAEAEKHLNWVIAHGHTSFQQIARLRLARLYIAENKPQEALYLLKRDHDKRFDGLIDEIRGDAYFAMNNREMARQAYRKALQELPNAEVIRPLLQMKYDNLAS